MTPPPSPSAPLACHPDYYYEAHVIHLKDPCSLLTYSFDV